MYIHWFPGHMTKALRMMKEEISAVDSVIYVLDSRAPLSSMNPSFNELLTNKTVLYVINKIDLVPTNEAVKWKNRLENEEKKCIMLNSVVSGGTKELVSKLKEINRDKIERYEQKGVRRTVRAMVIGVPNCGKSTLINNLIGKGRTVTGNRPGVTRGKQWVTVDRYLDVLDTPGTLFPDFSDQDKAIRLAMIGSVKDDVLDIEELSKEILKLLKADYPERLKERYKLSDADLSEADMLTEIAVSRGYMLKGGEPDIERTVKSIITDFRKQGFGKIILEKA